MHYIWLLKVLVSIYGICAIQSYGFFIDIGSVERKTVYDQQGIDEFAKKLKKIRKEKALTQEELALRSGLALSQIARMETSRINPTLSTVFRLARTFGVKPCVLLDFELPPKSSKM